MRTALLAVLLVLTWTILPGNIKAQEINKDTAATQSNEASTEDQNSIRLFITHIQKGNYEWALILWEQIKAKETPQLQYAYLEALEATGRKDSLYIKHREFLTKYPDYGPALFWEAKYHFNKAEKQYQYEIAKYNKNKNTTTYAYLRRELKRLSEDYRTAKNILEKLTQKDPTNKTQLFYLRNCYVRLEMQEEAKKTDKIINDL
jgi:tetratricopeptide (TPR) repeat protein